MNIVYIVKHKYCSFEPIWMGNRPKLNPRGRLLDLYFGLRSVLFLLYDMIETLKLLFSVFCSIQIQKCQNTI